MKERILVVTGSPRRGGNSYLMAGAFLSGASRSGYQVDRIDTAYYDIRGCQACDTCWSKNVPCTFDTEFNTLAHKLESADGVVFVTPLFWYSFPAQLKSFLDHTYSYAMPFSKRKLHIQRSALLVCGADGEMDKFDGIVASYRFAAQYNGWEDRGVIIAPGVCKKGDIVSSRHLQSIEELGRCFFK